MKNHSEESDDYQAIVARLNADWRVIVCAAGIQWILQYSYPIKDHGGRRWRSRSFCRTAEALNRVATQHGGPIHPIAATMLVNLPDRIEATVAVETVE